MTIPMPVQISDVSMAFPADALDYMPAWEDIPDKFKGTSYDPEGGKWLEFHRTWMFKGLSDHFAFQPATIDGVTLDGETIWRQLVAINGTYACKHQHKESAIAYLASIWMESMVYAEPGVAFEDHKVLGEATIEEWLEHYSKEESK